MNNDNNEQKKYFINTIAKFCDQCGSAYSIDDLEIIQESQISSIIHFSCRNCKASHIATFVKPLGLSHRVPINSDLDVKEISKYSSRGGTSSDEILQLYLYLKENKTITI